MNRISILREGDKSKRNPIVNIIGYKPRRSLLGPDEKDIEM